MIFLPLGVGSQYSRQIFERTTSELMEWEIREKTIFKSYKQKRKCKIFANHLWNINVPKTFIQQSFLYHFTVVMLFQNWTEIWSKGNLILFNTADGVQNKAPHCEHMKNQCVEIISCNIANLIERDCPNYFLLTWLFNVSVTETVWTFFFVFPSQASLQ